MPLREDLLTPIPGDNPSGINLRYDPVTDKVKEARREDLDVPQGDWKSTLKVADHNVAIKLAGEALATKGKDLQLAVWLVDSQVRKEGFAVLPDCFRFLRGLCTDFWDSVYPEIEDDDLEMRAAPLDWLGSKLDEPLRRLPLTASGLNWLGYQESRTIGYENPNDPYDKQEQRRKLIEDEGKLSADAYDKAVEETPLAFIEKLVGMLELSLAELAMLTEVLDEKFGQVSPSFIKVRSALEEILHVEQGVLTKKGGGKAAVPEAEETGAEGDSAQDSEASAPAARGRSTRQGSRLPDLGSDVPEGSDVFEFALQAATEGRLSEALGLLQAALASEISHRGRFRRRTQIAHVLMAAGKDRVAHPILEDLAAEIESRKLEEWERAETIAYPLFLLMKCSKTDDSTRYMLYLRLCRLDPQRASEVPE